MAWLFSGILHGVCKHQPPYEKHGSWLRWLSPPRDSWGSGSRATGEDSGIGGVRLRWSEGVVRAGDICGPTDRLCDNIGKPRLARATVCDAFRNANSADLLFAPSPARASRASSRAAAGARGRRGSGRLTALPRARVVVLVGLWLISNGHERRLD